MSRNDSNLQIISCFSYKYEQLNFFSDFANFHQSFANLTTFYIQLTCQLLHRHKALPFTHHHGAHVLLDHVDAVALELRAHPQLHLLALGYPEYLVKLLLLGRDSIRTLFEHF